MKINKLIILFLPLLITSCSAEGSQSANNALLKEKNFVFADMDTSKMEKIDVNTAKEEVLKEAEKNTKFENVYIEIQKNMEKGEVFKEVIYQDRNTNYKESEFKFVKDNAYMHTLNLTLEEVDYEYNFTAKLKELLYPDCNAYFAEHKSDYAGLFKFSSELISQENVNYYRGISLYNASYIDFISKNTPLDAYRNSYGEIVLVLIDELRGNECSLLFKEGKLISYYAETTHAPDYGVARANIKYNVKKPFNDSYFSDLTYQRDYDLIVELRNYFRIFK